MDITQIIINISIPIITSISTYIIAHQQGRSDLKKLREANEAILKKLIKQHEINLEALKEQHRMEMEAKEKDQEYKLQLLQKEYELKTKEQQQSKTSDVMTNVLGELVSNIVSNPSTAIERVKKLQNLGDEIKKMNVK